MASRHLPRHEHPSTPPCFCMCVLRTASTTTAAAATTTPYDGCTAGTAGPVLSGCPVWYATATDATANVHVSVAEPALHVDIRGRSWNVTSTTLILFMVYFRQNLCRSASFPHQSFNHVLLGICILEHFRFFSFSHQIFVGATGSLG